MPWFVSFAVGLGQAAAPIYDLDHLGVSISLPEGDWRLVRWSGDALVVDLAHPRGPHRLTAWSTGVQVAVAEGQAWGPAFAERLDLASAPGPTRADRVAGRPVALTELPDRGRGATLEAAGANLHVAVTGPQPPVVDAVLDHVLASLDGDVPEAGPYGATLELPGLALELPVGWRPALRSELRGAPEAGCEYAVFPRAAAPADRLTLCHLPLSLGIVDAYTAPLVEPEVRRAAIPDGKDAVGTLASVDGRSAFTYALPDRAVLVLPHAAGATRFELRASEAGSAAAQRLADSAEVDGDHPVSIADRAEYWLWLRPAPALLLMTAIGGVAMLVATLVARRPLRSPAPEPDDAP